MINIILDHLAKAEGIKVHYNTGEKDITAPYGIYKYRHKDAGIFKYISTVAILKDIYKDTNQWDKSNIAVVNDTMDNDEVRELAYEFYYGYLRNAHLQDFPKECVVAFADMFTNSPTMAMESVQEALVKLDHNPIENFNALSSIDGKYGAKTREALLIVGDNKQGMLLKSFMISAMKSNYVKLAIGDTGKYLQYLKGWTNRMDRLV